MCSFVVRSVIPPKLKTFFGLISALCRKERPILAPRLQLTCARINTKPNSTQCIEIQYCLCLGCPPQISACFNCSSQARQWPEVDRFRTLTEQEPDKTGLKSFVNNLATSHWTNTGSADLILLNETGCQATFTSSSIRLKLARYIPKQLVHLPGATCSLWGRFLFCLAAVHPSAKKSSFLLGFSGKPLISQKVQV